MKINGDFTLLSIAEYDLKPISCTAYGDGAGQITTVISEG